MTYKFTKYLCDFCDREYKVEKNAVKHQASCYHNPLRKACVTCKHFRNIQPYLSDDMRPDICCMVGFMPFENGQMQMVSECSKWEDSNA